MEISVIITNYNYERYLARAIRSVINQSYEKEEYEIIVIDDCSTDNSRIIIESFGERIKSIHNDQNIGLAASCNKAIKSALGKYIIRLDADDYVHNDWLKMHQLFLSNNKDEMHATSSDYIEVDTNENALCRKNAVTWPIACGIMYKTDHIIELGLYDDSLPREDVEFRQRFLKSGKQIYNIPIPLYRYTQHQESITKKM
jgi:glycosyltransferase involved in cell wall biosynthesis